VPKNRPQQGKNRQAMKRYKGAGFTLLELSIVLVIIGLIVGGVLVGRDLIKAAEIRATVNQIEKISTAVNTFKLKYGGLPGDLANASEVGMYGPQPGDWHYPGNGNGLITDCAGYTGLSCETTLFWRHLSDANLIEGSYGADYYLDVYGGFLHAPVTPVDTTPYFPRTKTGRGHFLAYGINGANYPPQYGVGGTNYLAILNLYIVSGSGVFTGVDHPLTPTDAYGIDVKMDDGLPYDGRVNYINPTQGNSVGPIGNNYPGTATLCALGTTTPNTYNVTVSSYECALRIGGVF
jgi:prepilin-type N-terminal cleavage/methylation domain-containing protein